MTAGKGDTRRPSAVGEAEFAERWRATFGRVIEQVVANSAPFDPDIIVHANVGCDCAKCVVQRDVSNALLDATEAELRRLADDDRA